MRGRVAVCAAGAVAALLAGAVEVAARPVAVSPGIARLLPATPQTLALGRRLFQARAHGVDCVLCHTLAAAGSQTPIGPNLDLELAGAEYRQYTDAQLAQVVRDLMHHGICRNKTDAS